MNRRFRRGRQRRCDLPVTPNDSRAPVYKVGVPGGQNGIPGQLIGQRVGHYKILHKIGSGGMAEDTTLDRQVALKVLPPELAGDTERRARFTREAKAVADCRTCNDE